MKFTIIGEPQGKQRPRHARGVVYTPKETKAYERAVAHEFHKAFPDWKPSAKPICMSIIAYTRPPKSTSKKRFTDMVAGLIHPTKKPDADNIAKIIMDALNGVAYEDDRQVVELIVRKFFSDTAYVDVFIDEL